MLRLTLASRIFLWQVAIVIAVVAAGAVAAVFIAREQLDRSYEQRSLAVADAVAALPEVREAVAAGDPNGILQPLAERIRAATGATFIVITDDRGIRFSHPNPARIGERVSTDPEPALSGERWSGTQEGTLGVSVRGKVPIWDDAGRVIGIVSVGFLQERVGSELQRQLPALGLYLAAALVLGAVASLFLSRRLKSQTFGLEPAEIAGLLDQREAILHGIREGIVAVDLAGRITLVNDEARRLLGLDPSSVGRPVEEVVPPGRVRDVLLGALERPDQPVLTGGRVLVANRMPVRVRDETIGAVVTLRDRTELADALRELEGVRAVTDALRAQAHEFSNRLHTIVGLVELGRHREAISLSTEDAVGHQEMIETIVDRIGDGTRLLDELDDPRDLVTVVGNLVDNAIDAASTGPSRDGRWVAVTVQAVEGGIRLRVADSGPGIPPEVAGRIFEEGFSTKDGTGQAMRGLGLAIVQQIVRRRGGEVRVETDGGAVFDVWLSDPAPATAAPARDGVRQAAPRVARRR
ncbi:MAG TPA: sensor histidine kinase [Candidatus Limnocylindrales bacterium]|nr:sensor histidine kinase [Candidatus Limnocylindrales bacterium]